MFAILFTLFLSGTALGEEPSVEPTETIEVIEEAPQPSAEEVVEEAPVEETAIVDSSAVEEVAVPADANEAVEVAFDLSKAIQEKNWPLVAGFILMLVVFGANKMGLKDKVGAKWVPWVVVLLGTASTVGIGLVSGVAVGEAILQGVLMGFSAIGSWEVVFKSLLKG